MMTRETFDKLLGILKEHQARLEEYGNLQDQQCAINHEAFKAIQLNRKLLLGLIDLLVEKDVIVPGDVIEIVEKSYTEEKDDD